MTVREYNQIHRDIEQSADLQYRALRYMRAVFAYESAMKRNLDLAKMTAEEYIEALRELSAIEDTAEWEMRYNELKTKYGKGEDKD